MPSAENVAGKVNLGEYMETQRLILAQLVDSDELASIDADELRKMLADLDDEVVYEESGEVVLS